MRHSPRELAAHHGRLLDKITSATPAQKLDYKAAHAKGEHLNHPIHRWQVEAHRAARQLAVLPVSRERAVVWRVEIGGRIDPIAERRVAALTDRVAAGKGTDADRAVVLDLEAGLVRGNPASERAVAWIENNDAARALRVVESGVGEDGWFVELEGTADAVRGFMFALGLALVADLKEGTLHVLSWPAGIAVLADHEYPQAWPWQEPLS